MELTMLVLMLLTLLMVSALLVAVLSTRKSTPTIDPVSLQPPLQQLLRDQEIRQLEVRRSEQRELRNELSRNLTDNRQELAVTIDKFRAGFQETLSQMQRSLEGQLDRFRTAIAENRKELTDTVHSRLEKVERGVGEMKTSVTESVSRGLTQLQEKNDARLEQIRKTVDEKLHQTLETRLTQSFEQVTRQLIEVQKGLTEMQSLAQDVGGLKKVLTNVKTRGIYGEAALEAILSEYLTPEQYEKNAVIQPRSQERVEFAVRLPGSDGDGHVLLPVDSKFPREDYERILEAFERGDKEAFEQAGVAFERRIRAHASDISKKYIHVPDSTDFALMFLPFESIYAEAIKRPGLSQGLQRDYKVVLTGPTTLTAFLNSLQMGFRTLAISKRSAEVWNVLGAVKTEFGKFALALENVQKNLTTATNNLGKVETRTRQMARQLKTVEALPDTETTELLPGEAIDADVDADDLDRGPS